MPLVFLRFCLAHGHWEATFVGFTSVITLRITGLLLSSGPAAYVQVDSLSCGSIPKKEIVPGKAGFYMVLVRYSDMTEPIVP